MAQRKTRAPRLPGRSGAPRPKAGTRSATQTGYTLNVFGGMPWVPLDRHLETMREHAQMGDVPALLEALHHCHRQGDAAPQWTVECLGRLLAEFLALSTPPKQRPRIKTPVFAPWARDYVRAFKDWMVAQHLELSVRTYGLTRAEALDEAECYFRGTKLAASTEALKKAWQRAVRRGRQGWFQRLPTEWESRVIIPQYDPPIAAGSARLHWVTINAERQGPRRGEWRERPRKLAALSPARLELEAAAVVAKWTAKWRRRRH